MVGWELFCPPTFHYVRSPGKKVAEILDVAALGGARGAVGGGAGVWRSGVGAGAGSG